MISKPFSRVIIRFGTPIYVPRELDECQFSRVQTTVAYTLTHLYHDTDALWQDKAHIKALYS